MKHLIHSFILKTDDGSTIKYEIYCKNHDLGYHKKVPEGSCQIISSKLDPDDRDFKVTDINLNIDALYKANQPAPNTWYSDGQDRVSLDMVISYLAKLK
ncbi:hypothetical protein [Citrobacter youngae]|uniref:hypothetical protein n=1 Tax=Citrobacter youngae TaxID=133448 RepID=UPI000E11D1A0|nr:hypothetical protein [Citrobacter youngae]SUY02786.1 Uncharacterised protein [Citrobacter youngae]